MILLVLDTALASCSVCVYDSTQTKILAEEREFMERGHAEALPPMVARVMAKSGLDYGDLNRIAVTTGPGTFTGIRIGLSFARAMGLACSLPVIGLDTLTATKAAVPKTDLPTIVAHQAGGSGFTYVMNDTVPLLLRSITLPDGPAIIIGTAADHIVAGSGRIDLQRYPHLDLPWAAAFAPFAASLPDSPNMPDPVYLREVDAKPQTAALRPLPGLHVRQAQIQDSSVLASLHKLCFAEAWDNAAFKIILETTGSTAFLAINAEGPVGLLVYREVAGEAEILTLGVVPSLRRRGVGKTLLFHLLAFNIPRVFLEVASRNQEAIALYSKAGFRQVGLRKSYYAGSGDDALILQWSA